MHLIHELKVIHPDLKIHWRKSYIGEYSFDACMKTWLVFVLIIIAAIIGLGIYTYTSIISPRADKPLIEPVPIPTQTQQLQSVTAKEPVVEEEHIQYLVNELGGYNLHDHPVNNEAAVMEFQVVGSDPNNPRLFTITIKDNYPLVADGAATNPDIRLHATETILLELLQADDFNTKVVELVNDGSMWIEVLADETTLAMKGYLSIYQQLTGDETQITGNVASEFRSKIVWRR